MSIWHDLLAACGTAAEATTGIPPVIVREELRGVVDDPTPFCLVAKGGPETPVDYAFTNLVCYRYPVVFLLVAGNRREFVPGTVELNLRERLREQVDRRTLSAVSSVTDVDLEPLDLTGLSSAVQSTYKVTGFRALYLSWETRVNA